MAAGATGGVGSITMNILAKKSYVVVGSTSNSRRKMGFACRWENASIHSKYSTLIFGGFVATYDLTSGMEVTIKTFVPHISRVKL